MEKQPWTDDLEEFKAMLNPKSKSYQDVVQAVEVAWQAAFNRYSTMLIYKDESEGQELMKQVQKELDFKADFEKWYSLMAPELNEMTCLEGYKRTWEEAYNTYVRYGQTQASMDEFTKRETPFELGVE